MSALAESHAFLIAEVAQKQLALPVRTVSEMIRSVALSPIPGAPRVIEGALNLRGKIVPVVDIRSALDLGAKEHAPTDYLVVLELRNRLSAIRVDDILEVREILPAEIEATAPLSATLASVRAMSGIVAQEDGALVIFDPEAFLTEAEERALSAALVGP